MSTFSGPYLPVDQVLLGRSLEPVRRSWFSLSPLLRWEVHPQSSIWEQYAPVENDVKDYLQHHHDLRTASGAFCSLCFVGRSETQVKAAIVIHCDDKSCRSMALQIIGNSPEWRTFKQEHPAFILMSAPKAPSPCGSNVEQDDFTIYGVNDADLCIGTAVIFGNQTSIPGPNDIRMARLGPIIFHDRQPYVVSVSHPIQYQTQHVPPTEGDYRATDNPEIFLSSSPTDSNDLDDAWDMFIEEDITLNTPDSGSPSPKVLKPTPELEDTPARLTSESIIPISNTTNMSLRSTPQETDTTTTTPTTDTLNRANSRTKIIGQVAYKSSDVPSKQHDWVLIKPDQSIYDQMKQDRRINAVPGLESSRSSIYISGAANIPRNYKFVWLVTSTGKCEEAILSGSRCSYRLPKTHRFLDVLPLHTSRPLMIGDSGTAVIDPENGSWYGQIIAAENDGNVGYVLPASEILKSIAQNLGVSRESLAFKYERSEGLSRKFYPRSEPTYSYQPLQPGELRLLKLCQSDKGNQDNLQGILQNVSLEELPEFVAISHVWSREVSDYPLYIHGERLGITADLAAALSMVSLHYNPTFIWVDMICTNCYDSVERESQIPIMSKIFKQAKAVAVWLGEGNAETDYAVDYLLNTAQYRLISSFYQSLSIENLRALFERPWFNRLWVVQEVAFARDLVVYCGTRQVAWDKLRDVASFLSTERGWTEETTLKSLKGFDHYFPDFQDHEKQFLPNTGALLFPRTGSLSELLHLSRSLTVSDPRDRVYALLGLVREPIHIRIDYSKSFIDVVFQTVEHMIQFERSLDVLCRPWIPRADHLKLGDNVPSWIMSWDPPDTPLHVAVGSNKSVSFQHQTVFEFVNRRFRAGGLMHDANVLANDTGSSSNLVIRDYLHRLGRANHIIQSTGLILGSLEKLGELNLVHPYTSRLIRPFTRDRKSHEYENLWRTLFADCDIHGQRPAPVWYGSALAAALDDGMSEYGHSESLDDLAGDKIGFKTVTRRIATVTKGRQLAILLLNLGTDPSNHLLYLRESENQKLVLVPASARKGDLVCILHGCSVPVVLRRAEYSTQNEELSDSAQATIAEHPDKVECTIVGESYVHGVMDGEALSDPTFPKTEFILF